MQRPPPMALPPETTRGEPLDPRDEPDENFYQICKCLSMGPFTVPWAARSNLNTSRHRLRLRLVRTMSKLPAVRYAETKPQAQAYIPRCPVRTGGQRYGRTPHLEILQVLRNLSSGLSEIGGAGGEDDHFIPIKWSSYRSPCRLGSC